MTRIVCHWVVGRGEDIGRHHYQAVQRRRALSLAY